MVVVCFKVLNITYRLSTTQIPSIYSIAGQVQARRPCAWTLRRRENYFWVAPVNLLRTEILRLL